jgi:hypothetical protein
MPCRINPAFLPKQCNFVCRSVQVRPFPTIASGKNGPPRLDELSTAGRRRVYFRGSRKLKTSKTKSPACASADLLREKRRAIRSRRKNLGQKDVLLPQIDPSPTRSRPNYAECVAVWRGGIQMRRRRNKSGTMPRPKRASVAGSGTFEMLMSLQTACPEVPGPVELSIP